MSTIASQITSHAIVYSAVYSGADQRKHQSSASLASVWGIHRGPVNSPHKGPVTRKMFPFDDVIMWYLCMLLYNFVWMCTRSWSSYCVFITWRTILNIPSSLLYKSHFSRQLKCWSLRCSWSIACRRCSNYIFILSLTPGFNGLGKDNYKMRREAF